MSRLAILHLVRAVGVAVLVAASPPAAVAEPRDPQHDFDFQIGKWKLQVRKLKEPLHDSRTWIELTGSSIVRPLWNGRAQLEELELDSATAGHFSGMTVRLYSPTARQWSLHWANQKVGRFDVPAVGGFKDGRGEFYDQDVYEGRAILVRLVWSNITPRSAHIEQAFSADGGKTWEVNWIADQTRIE